MQDIIQSLAETLHITLEVKLSSSHQRLILQWNQLIAQIRLHIKSQPHVPIEKPFSKTHAPLFGIGVLEKFYFLQQKHKICCQYVAI